MPHAYESLALAASSYNGSRENRLTEIFGTVLQSHSGFANYLLETLELPAIERPDVSSQERLPEQGQIDLTLRGAGARGSSVLYIENKEPRGGWQDGQPQKYLKALRREIRLGPKGRLLVIVSEATDAHGRVRRRVGAGSELSAVEGAAQLRREGSDELIVYATWHEVAGWAFEAGLASARDRGDWIADARGAASRADQRLLAELIWYLEEEGYGMTKAVNGEQIKQARAALELTSSLDELVRDVSQRLAAPEGNLRLARVQGSQDVFHPPRGSWVERYDGRFYFTYDVPASTNNRADSQREKGSDLWFYVGATVRSRLGERALQLDPDWAAKVVERGLVPDGGDVSAAYDAMQLDGISTLSEQGQELARWAFGQVRAILELKPPSLRRSRSATRS